jgi:osmotically-inducible protein OsmY
MIRLAVSVYQGVVSLRGSVRVRALASAVTAARRSGARVADGPVGGVDPA